MGAELRTHWLVLLACFFGVMLGVWSFPFYTLGPLSGSLREAFGWPLSDLLETVSFQALGLTIGTLLIGRYADRLEPRLIGGAGTAALGVCFIVAANFDGELWQFRALFFTIGLLGAGSGGLIFTRVVGTLFHKARGLALGITLSGTGVGGFLSPLLVHEITALFGWRGVYWTLAGFLLLVGLPIIYFGLGKQGRPQDHVIKAAVDTAADPAPAQVQPAAEIGVTRAQAMRDPRFYIMILSVSIFGIFIASLVINLMPVMLEQGISPVHAAQITSLIGISMIIGRLGMGWMLDHVRPHIVGIICFGVGTAGVALFAWQGGMTVIAAAIVIGFLTGAEFDLMSYMTMRYFGVRSYGAIFALLYSFYTGLCIVGPWIGGALISVWGLSGLFAVAAIAFFIATIGMALLPLASRGRSEIS